MSMQLILIDDSDHDWRIDEQTRRVGLEGVAAARDVLRSIPRRSADEDSENADGSDDRAATRRRAA